MASLWQKTLFYLGLVDEEQTESAARPEPLQTPEPGVRTVEAPREMRSLQTPPPGAGMRAPGRVQEPRTAPPPRTSGVVAGRRVEPPARQRRRISANPSHAEAGVLVHDGGAPLRPLPPEGVESEVIVARSFSDAQTLADNLREARPVVLDLRSTEPEMVRRLVDFSSGLTYALDGKMAKIGQGVILVTPPGVSLSADEQHRLADLGLYSSPTR